MNRLQAIVSDLRNQETDERTNQVRGNAAWYGLLTLFISYLALSIGYSVSGQVVPWTTQLLFYVPLIIFAITNFKQDGYQFLIPGMAETPTTLDQPAALRSIPWLILVNAILSFIFFSVTRPIYTYFKVDHISAVLIINLLLSIPGFIASYYYAERIKRGDRLFINLSKLLAFFSVFVGSPVTAYVMHANQSQFPPSPADIFFFISNIWIWLNLMRYGKRMIDDGQSYEKLAPYNQQKDRRNKYILIFVYLILPFLIFFGFFGLGIYSVNHPNGSIERTFRHYFPTPAISPANTPSR